MTSLLNKPAMILIVVVFSLMSCSEDEQSSKVEQMPEKATATAPTMTEPVAEATVESEPEAVAEIAMEEEAVVVKSMPLEASILVPEPVAELKHDVVTAEEIYKDWPYQEEARNLAEPSMTQQAMDSAKDSMDSLSAAAEDEVVNKLADMTGQSTESVAGVVAVAKDVMDSSSSGGAEHDVSAKGLTAFDKPIIYIAVGDTVNFKKLNGGHNSKSVIVPEGAEGWEGAMNKNISVTLTVPGIYGYLCVPHAGLGMNGVIVVGDAGDKEVVMEKLRALPQTDFSRKLLGKVNKVKPENYVK